MRVVERKDRVPGAGSLGVWGCVRSEAIYGRGTRRNVPEQGPREGGGAIRAAEPAADGSEHQEVRDPADAAASRRHRLGWEDGRDVGEEEGPCVGPVGGRQELRRAAAQVDHLDDLPRGRSAWPGSPGPDSDARLSVPCHLPPCTPARDIMLNR